MGDCIERTPYVSLIALVLTFTGSGMMCGTSYEALRRANVIFEDNFYPIRGTGIMQIIGIVYCVATILFGLVNFSAGTCATGKTRQRVYAHKKSQSTGKKYSRVLLGITYSVTFIWLLLFVVLAIPVGLWLMLHRVCREETEYWRSISADKDETLFTYTFNLTQYGLYRRPLDTSLYSESINSPSSFTRLCEEVSTIGPLFTIALFSSFLVLLGLNCFASCLSSSAVRLDFSSDINEMRQFPKVACVDGGMAEYPMHPLLAQPAFPSSSGCNAQSHTFAYSETISNRLPPSAVSDGTLSQIQRPNPYTHQPSRY